MCWVFVGYTMGCVEYVIDMYGVYVWYHYVRLGQVRDRYSGPASTQYDDNKQLIISNNKLW